MMKINLIIYNILILIFINIVYAENIINNPLITLQKRLNQINNFYAIFTQVITDHGNVIQYGKGKIWIKKPNQFNWHLKSPEEMIIITDGITLWIYNPIIKQVTINLLKNIADNIPFFLKNQFSNVNLYKFYIKQKGDSFTLIPKTNNKDFKKYMITITPCGKIKNMILISQNNQFISYNFTNQNNNFIKSIKFHFRLPKGTILDDQR